MVSVSISQSTLVTTFRTTIDPLHSLSRVISITSSKLLAFLSLIILLSVSVRNLENLFASAFQYEGGFMDPSCDCGPQNPHHLQQAFCASHFVLKVKVLKSKLNFTNPDEAGEWIYYTKIKKVLFLSERVPQLYSNELLKLQTLTDKDSCGVQTSTVRDPVANKGMLRNGEHYLVTGRYVKGQFRLAVCSYIALWPSKRQRKEYRSKTRAGNVISRTQAKYLRQRIYASHCHRCKIEEGSEVSNHLIQPTKPDTCFLNAGKDPYMCYSQFAYCGYHIDYHTKKAQCIWTTTQKRKFYRCSDESREEIFIRYNTKVNDKTR